MPHLIEGRRFFTTEDAATAFSVSRQSLWRWRREGRIPAGHRLRNRQVVFTEAEFEQIREYATWLEPIQLDNPDALQRAQSD
jgi:predicted DNA-binding transcriptional regulator AlpA